MKKFITFSQAGKLFVALGAFMVVGGYFVFQPASADTAMEQMAVWSPVLIAGGLCIIAAGFTLVVLLYMIDY